MTMIWNQAKKNYQESTRVDAFLNEIKQVCLRHGMTLELEDDNGSFVVETCGNDGDVDWLMNAIIGFRLGRVVEQETTNNKGE
jgi:hypothetical protein